MAAQYSAAAEQLPQENWLERGSEVDQASLRWDRLSAEALKPADSIKLLRQLARELRDG
ncbi:hypothetical protein Athai_35320 [Actinocatenispora thailandica]|uniref:Uncharacterized protein n=1 Tax=Actinocatenispora thailandica TaxID=227318 RepID=A0A7R7DQN5_9ACTN|nr:hypothetical protein [Actinocatenispora thailandica]BCJ36029.1 hypothetical protein Athai_35320 [Actinocatenispora thailandica]